MFLNQKFPYLWQFFNKFFSQFFNICTFFNQKLWLWFMFSYLLTKILCSLSFCQVFKIFNWKIVNFLINFQFFNIFNAKICFLYPFFIFITKFCIFYTKYHNFCKPTSFKTKTIFCYFFSWFFFYFSLFQFL